jgi:hypothetical protein
LDRSVISTVTFPYLSAFINCHQAVKQRASFISWSIKGISPELIEYNDRKGNLSVIMKMSYTFICVILLTSAAKITEAVTSTQRYESLGESVFSLYTKQWLTTHSSWAGSTPYSTGCGEDDSPVFPVCIDGYRLESYDTDTDVSTESNTSSNSLSDRSHRDRSGESSGVGDDNVESSNLNSNSHITSNRCSSAQCIPYSSHIPTVTDTIDYYPPPEDYYRRLR